ncbi:ABC transporter permease subunit [bacterium]|nr:ABC transporter permease subunit [bacterium]
MFGTQLRNELLKLFARKRTYIGFGAFLFVQVAILLLLQLPKAKRAFRQLLEANGYAFEQYYSGLTLGLLIILFTVGLLGALYLALVAGDMVAKEVEEGTMRMTLARPVSRLRILVVKSVACGLYTFVLIAFIGVTSLLAGVLYRGGLGKLFLFAPQEHVFALFDTGEGLWRYTRGVLFMGLCLQVVSSLGLMLSCFKMKPAAATILTLSVLFVDFVLRNVPYFASFEQWFITYHTTCWVRTLHDIVPWWSIIQSLVYLAALNLSFWVIGAMSFCSRDFKA